MEKIQQELMAKFFNKSKKPWAIFGQFSQFLGQKNFFPENLALSRTTSYGFLAPCQNLENTNDTVPRKRLDRQKYRRTLFYRTLPATTGGPKRREDLCVMTLRIDPVSKKN